MQVFISGTDTNVGKTLISSWIALHTGFSYFKPIQTGVIEGTDTEVVQGLSLVTTYPETYRYQAPLSPHLAAARENELIQIDKIQLPQKESLIVEGAGGLLVPINDRYLMIDLIKRLNIPVILVARTSLGTINHTLLSLEILRSRQIPILGVIMNGEQNSENSAAISAYGDTCILAEFPRLAQVNQDSLRTINFPDCLRKILQVQ
jgi:dethiobiotin synthetase